MAAGVTWASLTASAQWGYRYGHTSVIDAAGAIYVIGGWGSTLDGTADGADVGEVEGSTDLLKDVWVSTDGGSRPDYVGVGC